jgi:2TM domain
MFTFRGSRAPIVEWVAMTEDPRVSIARRRVAAMQGFYIHASIFAGVMVLLAVINAMTGGVWWVQWPIMGWGVGVLAHGLAVFGLPGLRLFSPEWEERKVKEIVDKMRT